MKQLNQICLLSLLFILMSGCTSIRYYSQAVGGQISLLMAGEPIPELVADPATSSGLRESLITAVDVREFARYRLALPVGGSFQDYVELDRPWVVLNLVAVPEFSLEPHHWCYPVIGCQAYRGYFRPDYARAEQRQFDARGYDTFLGGVTAYSTLGWFDDPLHSGFTRLSTDRMAALIIHELSHQVVYVAGDTAFNESYATAVELEGLKLWLDRKGKQADFRPALDRLKQRNQTLALVEGTVAELEALYARQDSLNTETLRARKEAILEDLTRQYRRLAADWHDPGPFGRNPESLNNAHLALFRQYNQYVPGFRQLFREHNRDFAAFHEAVIRLSELPEADRQQRLLDSGKRFDEHL
ncbi:aminopeptidase [Marinobacter sp.]|uniref:aminopeptidase n=1 Tax=Marinobacter sp. TaxID=50741 RepID=UPI00385084A3